MAVKAKIKTVIHISASEFQQWMRNSRLIILGVMLVFIHMQVISPLKECARLMGERISTAEAFVALGNSGIIVLAVPALFLVLVADYPRRGGIDFFYQIRCSKKEWVCGQALFAVEASVFVAAFLAIASGVMTWGTGEMKMQFSHAVTHYVTAFPERSGDYLTQLLPENLYQQMTLGTAVFHTVMLMVLYFLLLALILLLSAVCNKKSAGILADGFLIILGTITCAVRTKLMWVFPMAHTISWLHYEEYLNRQVFPMKGSYLYMAGACTALFLCSMVMARKYQAGKD